MAQTARTFPARLLQLSLELTWHLSTLSAQLKVVVQQLPQTTISNQGTLYQTKDPTLPHPSDVPLTDSSSYSIQCNIARTNFQMTDKFCREAAGGESIYRTPTPTLCFPTHIHPPISSQSTALTCVSCKKQYVFNQEREELPQLVLVNNEFMLPFTAHFHVTRQVTDIILLIPPG